MLFLRYLFSLGFWLGRAPQVFASSITKKSSEFTIGGNLAGESFGVQQIEVRRA